MHMKFGATTRVDFLESFFVRVTEQNLDATLRTLYLTLAMHLSDLPFDVLELIAQATRNLPPNPVFDSRVPRLPIVAFASTNRRIRGASLPALVRHIRIQGPCHLADEIATNLLKYKSGLLVFIR